MEPAAYRVAFGERVRELRKAKGFTQEAFAHYAGLDRADFGRLERGQRNPTLDSIVELAEALDVDIRELFPPT